MNHRIRLATAISNGLIVYDFTVYSFSAAIIGRLFFPSASPLTSLLMSLATFGVGFVMRPLGAMFIGNLADRHGRKVGMTVSISLMALGTMTIALMPPYAAIGVIAPIMIVAARLMQGLATGGEIGTASAVMMEFSDPAHRCYQVSWRAASQGAAAMAGALVGAGCSALLAPEDMQNWGWRLSFLLGLLIVPVGWYLRRQMVESATDRTRRPTLGQVFTLHGRSLWFGILLMAAPTASIYIMVFHMPTWLVNTLHMPATISLLSSGLAGAAIFVGTPLLARVADRQQGRKPIQFTTLLLSCALIYPAFLALTSNVGTMASVTIIVAYAAIALTNAGASTVMMLEAFPRRHRATGMSIIYSFGVTLFGGFSPFIVTWLIGITGNPVAPAWYLLAALGISLFALRRFPSTAGETPAAPSRRPDERHE